MEKKETVIHSKMRNLIANSCDFESRPNEEFQKFHKNLLKFSFNAIDVKIDYDEKLISIWNSKPLTTDPVRLFYLNEAIAEVVGYTDLEETLTGCLENGHLQNNFYKKVLSEFGYSLENDDDVLSA